MKVRPCVSPEDNEELHRSLGLSDKDQNIKEEVPSDSEIGAQGKEPPKNRKLLSDGGCLDTKNTIPRHFTAPVRDREIKEEVPSASEKASHGNEPSKRRQILSDGGRLDTKNAISCHLTAPVEDQNIKEEESSDSDTGAQGNEPPKKRRIFSSGDGSNSKNAIPRLLAAPVGDHYIKEEEPSASEERNTEDILNITTTTSANSVNAKKTLEAIHCYLGNYSSPDLDRVKMKVNLEMKRVSQNVTVPLEKIELSLNLFKPIIFHSKSKDGDDTNSIQLDHILDWFKDFVSMLSSSALQNIKAVIKEAKDGFDNKGYRVPLHNFTLLMQTIYGSIYSSIV